jgi:light-independent protochlorophyllide reductase subunit N
VLRERGQREVFCGLTGIIWLHRKIQDAFFLVVGSRTCAHLMQSAAGVMIFAEPRFATAIIDERDLAGLADANAELDRVVTGCWSAAPTSSCCSWSAPARPRSSSWTCRAPPSGCRRSRAACAGAQLFGQRHRDHLHAGRGRLPGRAGAELPRHAADAPSLLVVGTLADVVEDQFRACSTQLGIGPVQFFPPRRATSCRPSGRTPACCWRSPSWPTPRGARGAAARSAAAGPVPAGRRGHDLWLQAAATPLACPPTRFAEQASAPPAKRARRPRLAATAASWPASASSSSPTRSSRVPLARFLSRELGMQLVEVGTPYLHRSTWRRSWRCCPPARSCPKARTSSASSTAAAPPAPDSWSAAWAWPTRWRPRA